MCGVALPPPPPPRVKLSELVEVFAKDGEDRRRDYLDRLARTAVERGYKPGWISNKYKAKYQKWPPFAWLDAAIREARREYEGGSLPLG
jgi:hypothetical protein